MKPYSDACERNKEPILTVLREMFRAPGTVLEIGSGTGQHAVHFARHLPHLTWITADRADYLPGIRQWLDEAALPNLRGPLLLDVLQAHWPLEGPLPALDYVFSANTAHIMSWPAVEAMFAGAGARLKPGGRFALYGPFNRDGQFTSESNRAFDASLRERDPAMGIRDDRAIEELARRCGLALVADHAMPANNRLLDFVAGQE